MSAVNVTNVTVLDNPSMFQNPFQFEISCECLVPLKDDLEWKLIYVGSAEDEKYDQVLESVLVGFVRFSRDSRKPLLYVAVRKRGVGFVSAFDTSTWKQVNSRKVQDGRFSLSILVLVGGLQRGASSHLPFVSKLRLQNVHQAPLPAPGVPEQSLS